MMKSFQWERTLAFPMFCVVAGKVHPGIMAPVLAVEPVTCNRLRKVTNSVLKLFNLCCSTKLSFDEDASGRNVHLNGERSQTISSVSCNKISDKTPLMQFRRRHFCAKQKRISGRREENKKQRGSWSNLQCKFVACFKTSLMISCVEWAYSNTQPPLSTYVNCHAKNFMLNRFFIAPESDAIFPNLTSSCSIQA